MFSKIRQALRTAVQVQHLALLLAWAATVLPAYALVPLVLLARRRGDSPAG